MRELSKYTRIIQTNNGMNNVLLSSTLNFSQVEIDKNKFEIGRASCRERV